MNSAFRNLNVSTYSDEESDPDVTVNDDKGPNEKEIKDLLNKYPLTSEPFDLIL